MGDGFRTFLGYARRDIAACQKTLLNEIKVLKQDIPGVTLRTTGSAYKSSEADTSQTSFLKSL
jgi:hypothetical protein